MSQATPNRAAKRLNAHHEAKCAGFYAAGEMSGRFFQARVRGGVMQVTPDLQEWIGVDLKKVSFVDHNGRAISL